MEKIYKKTITTIFMVPTLGIDRGDLSKNNFINAYLGDIDLDLYLEQDVVFLLFKPNDRLNFDIFLEKERQRTTDLIDDYDYHDNYVVLVYSLSEEYKTDFNLIRHSKYSQTSKKFQNLFPKQVTDYSNDGNRTLPSLQHMIFSKDERLQSYWENELGTTLISRRNLEIWPGFDEKKELLDMEQIDEL
jgi:hypothetical protein